jgi:hypothetical protein
MEANPQNRVIPHNQTQQGRLSLRQVLIRAAEGDLLHAVDGGTRLRRVSWIKASYLIIAHTGIRPGRPRPPVVLLYEGKTAAHLVRLCDRGVHPVEQVPVIFLILGTVCAHWTLICLSVKQGQRLNQRAQPRHSRWACFPPVSQIRAAFSAFPSPGREFTPNRCRLGHASRCGQAVT